MAGQLFSLSFKGPIESLRPAIGETCMISVLYLSTWAACTSALHCAQVLTALRSGGPTGRLPVTQGWLLRNSQLTASLRADI